MSFFNSLRDISTTIFRTPNTTPARQRPRSSSDPAMDPPRNYTPFPGTGPSAPAEGGSSSRLGSRVERVRTAGLYAGAEGEEESADGSVDVDVKMEEGKGGGYSEGVDGGGGEDLGGEGDEDEEEEESTLEDLLSQAELQDMDETDSELLGTYHDLAALYPMIPDQKTRDTWYKQMRELEVVLEIPEQQSIIPSARRMGKMPETTGPPAQTGLLSAEVEGREFSWGESMESASAASGHRSPGTQLTDLTSSVHPSGTSTALRVPGTAQPTASQDISFGSTTPTATPPRPNQAKLPKPAQAGSATTAQASSSKQAQAQAHPSTTTAHSTRESWARNPNQHARILQDPLSFRHSRQQIQSAVGDAHYAYHDTEVRDHMWQLMDTMEVFAHTHFGFRMRALPSSSAGGGGRVAAEAYARMGAATAKVVACVASGGPGGLDGWDELFLDVGKRQALVCAVLGNVLVEQVLKHECFGGKREHLASLAEMQAEMRDGDGFDRNKKIADYLSGQIKNPARIEGGKEKQNDEEFFLPSNFNNHITNVIAGIWTHLRPIYQMGFRFKDTNPIPNRVFTALHKIVTHAGLLSLVMRLDRHTVYHFEPVFKEANFDPDRMDCFNNVEMQEQNPRASVAGLSEAEQARRATLSDKEKRRARNDSPITQITMMESLCAYRVGGWEAQDSMAGKPKYEKANYARQGIRSRTLTYAWVYCRWGRSRGFYQGKAAVGEEKTHGDGWKGGFRDFTDVEGVTNWLEQEKARRQETV